MGESRIDWLGSALASLGLAGLVFGLSTSLERGFGDALVIAALTVGAGSLVSFVVAESKVQWPMMPLHIFKSRSFTGADLVTFLLYAGLGGSTFLIPLNLVLVQGYSATAAGGAMLPFILIVAVVSRWAGWLVMKTDPRVPLVVGPLVTGVALLLLTRPGIGGSYWTTYFPAIVVFGLGMGVTVAPLVTVVMGTVEQRLSGLASGINNAVTRTAILLAVAIFGVVALAMFNGSLDDKLEAIGAPADVIEHLEGERTKLAGAELPGGLLAETAVAVQRAIDEAFVDAFRGVMYLGAALAFAAALIALLVVERRIAPRGDPS
jgi:hypothetical protein